MNLLCPIISIKKIVFIIFFYYKEILIKIQILGEFLAYCYGLTYPGFLINNLERVFN